MLQFISYVYYNAAIYDLALIEVTATDRFESIALSSYELNYCNCTIQYTLHASVCKSMHTYTYIRTLHIIAF